MARRPAPNKPHKPVPKMRVCFRKRKAGLAELLARPTGALIRVIIQSFSDVTTEALKRHHVANVLPILALVADSVSEYHRRQAQLDGVRDEEEAAAAEAEAAASIMPGRRDGRRGKLVKKHARKLGRPKGKAKAKDDLRADAGSDDRRQDTLSRPARGPDLVAKGRSQGGRGPTAVPPDQDHEMRGGGEGGEEVGVGGASAPSSPSILEGSSQQQVVEHQDLERVGSGVGEAGGSRKGAGMDGRHGDYQGSQQLQQQWGRGRMSEEDEEDGIWQF